MIPIHLTLQGIYSYQEKQTIDFAKLTEAGIFGIFGSVGSGKSTILEAITYALYGKTDRLNIAGDNRYYNMMNLKSNELLIEFIFKTGKEDTEYLTTLKSKRNSKQFDDVKSLDRAAYKKINNQWQPIEINSLEAIIGLSYENFKRTIIIPQNKFQEFLQLGNKDRTQMMKELFNLNKYELYYKVVSIESKNNQQIQNLEGQLQQLGEINPEQITIAAEALTRLIDEIKLKSDELFIQQEKERKFNSLKELVLKAIETKKILLQLKNQEADILLMEKNIQKFEYCTLNFKNLLEAAKEITSKINRFEKEIGEDTALLDNTTQLLNGLEITYEAIKKEFNTRESFKKQADELLKIIKLQQLDKTKHELDDRITKGNKIYNETVEKIAQSKIKKNTFIAAIDESKLLYPDMAMLSEVRSWYTLKKSITAIQTETASELSSIQKELQEIENQKSVLWDNEYFAAIPQTVSFVEAAAALENKKQQIQLLIRDLTAETEHLSVQSKLEEYAASLEENKPCPLCGALNHPQPLNAQNVSEALMKVKDQKTSFEKAITGLDKYQKKLHELNTLQQIKNEQQKKIVQKQNEISDKSSNHQSLFKWDAYKEESNVIDAFTKAEQLKLQIQQKEADLLEFNQKLEKEILNKDIYYQAVEEIRHQLTAAKSETSTLSGQISIFNIQEFENKSMEEIETLIESLLLRYKETGIAFETTNTLINKLRAEKSSISGRMEANRKTLAQEIAEQKSIEVKLTVALAKSEFDTITVIEKILAQVMDIEAERKKVSVFMQSLDYSVKQHDALEKEIGDQVYDEEQHQAVLLSVGQITDDLLLKNQLQGKLNSEFNKLKTDLEKQKTLKKLWDQLQARAEDLKTLKQLFKASGFVNYISSVYLHELCHAANARFYKLTSQKLSLEVTDDNNFQVRDFMNGGKVRNVKTLSGGQTFQAALSLALALADNIQKITDSNQNFFFLDEGFGSLDPESLNIVFDTLKSLRKENRIVGVISHVKEMQQEIDAHLLIKMDEELGSKIKCSLY